jgi:hypothetical protein
MAFISSQNTKANWIETGRAYQRLALQATAFGLRHAFINQAAEVPAVRSQFADFPGIDRQRPGLVVRFGYGPTLPRSLRPTDQDGILSVCFCYTRVAEIDLRNPYK